MERSCMLSSTRRSCWTKRATSSHCWGNLHVSLQYSGLRRVPAERFRRVPTSISQKGCLRAVTPPLAVATPGSTPQNTPNPSAVVAPPTVPSSSPTSTRPAVPIQQQNSNGSSSQRPAFNWMAQWYPVAVVDQLDSNSPHAVTVLGRKLVVWKDGNDNWRCFDDTCPHRMAPLSEGRIDAGRLMCSYHGWKFDGQGQCVSIPQAMDAASEQAARGSTRCRVQAYPIQEREGLLWVWPDGSPTSWIDSAARPLPLPPQFLDSSAPNKPLVFTDWFWRDLLYPWDALVENLLDPSHVSFAHDGVIGPPSSRDAAQPISMQIVGNPLETDRIECRYSTGGFGGAAPSPDLTNYTYFDAPCHYLGRAGGIAGASFFLHFYAVPVTASTSRIYARFHADVGVSLPDWLPGLVSALPLRWLGHLSNMEVLDGDNVLIAGQASRLRQRGEGWRKQYYMPAQADKGIVAFRSWLDNKAGGAPPYGTSTSHSAGLPESDFTQVSRYDLLERYNSHVAQCRDCQQALSVVKGGKAVGQVLCASSLASASADVVQLLSGRASALPRLLGKLAVAGALGGATAALNDVEQRFYFVDYRHDKR